MAELLPQLLVLAGVALVIAEALAPGAHFIVLGVALLVAGLAGLAFSPLASPIALAVMVVAVGGATFLAYRELDIYGGKGQAQTSDSSSLKGSTGRVTERVTATDGEVKLEDGGFNPYYRARAFDGEIEVGEEVIVVDPGGGNVITVESMSEMGTDKLDRELERARKNRADETADDGDAGGSQDGGGDPAGTVERESETEAG